MAETHELVARWLEEGEKSGLSITAYNPTNGKSAKLERPQLAELLGRLLAYEAALNAPQPEIAKAAAEALAEIGVDARWFQGGHDGRPLFVGTRGGRTSAGKSLRELLDFFRHSQLADPREKRVFIVDDDESVREMLFLFVSREGFETELFEDALQLEAELRARRDENMPHLILLDLMMPGKGGVEALRELQSEAPKVRVMLVTARVLDGAFVEELRAEPNVAELLCKPVERSRLVGLMHGVLGTKPREKR